LDDTWEYDGSDWRQLTIAPAPERREGHALVYDIARGRALMFGGLGVSFLNDTVELLPAPIGTWTRHGPGCAGSAGTPALDALPTTIPARGASFTLRLTSLPAQPGLALLAFGFDLALWNGIPLPMALDSIGLPGCRLWIGPAPGGTLLLARPGVAMNFTF